MMQDALNAMLQATMPVADEGISGWQPPLIGLLPLVDIAIAIACFALGGLCWWARGRRPLGAVGSASALTLIGAFLALFGVAQLLAVMPQLHPLSWLAVYLKILSVGFALSGAIALLLNRSGASDAPGSVSADPSGVAEELSRCQKEFDEFVYSVSHDLREPLRGIRNYAAFLTEDYAAQLDEDGRARLQTITRLVVRMETQLDALHTLSRVARAPLQRVATNLNDVAEAAGKRQQSVRGVGYATIVIDPLPALDCDPQWTTELLSQLIANALVFNTDAAASVRVGQQGEDAFGHAVLFVRDDGIGIEARHHDDVFGLFRRLHGREEYGGGIGAGLTVAHKIVERHGGRIWLASAPGAGTTVMFTLGAKRRA